MDETRLTELQFLVLRALVDKDLPGCEVRKILPNERSGPAFYTLMQRCENAGFVEGRYEGGRYKWEGMGARTFREKWYRLTPDGQQAHDAFLEKLGVQPAKTEGDK